MSGGARWTDDDVQRLRELYAQDLPLPDIAGTLHRTPHAVAVRLSQLRAEEGQRLSSRRPRRIRSKITDPRAIDTFLRKPACR